MEGYPMLLIIRKWAKKLRRGGMTRYNVDAFEQNHKLNPSGRIGFFPQNVVGDDVVLFSDETALTHRRRLSSVYANKRNVAKQQSHLTCLERLYRRS